MVRLAVLGIFSFHSNGHVAFWLFWASFPFMEVGHIVLGHFGAFFLMKMVTSHVGCFGHVVLSLK